MIESAILPLSYSISCPSKNLEFYFLSPGRIYLQISPLLDHGEFTNYSKFHFQKSLSFKNLQRSLGLKL